MKTYLFAHRRARSWAFLKLQGLQYYFPENFRGNLTYCKNGIFVIAISIIFFNPKILGLFFFYEK